MSIDNRVTLKELIAEHERHCGETLLRDSFGDGYLFTRNPIFRNVRAAAHRAGYRYTTENVANYRTFPLGALHHILGEKKIPYAANADGLRAVERQRPDFFDCSQMRMPLPNVVMHESAHCVAATRLPASLFASLRLNDERKIALRELMCESYANATEAMAWRYVECSEHRLMLQMNSFNEQDARTLAIVSPALQRFDEYTTFQMLYFTYLYSNFLYAKLDAPRVDLICAMSGMPKSSLRDARAVVRVFVLMAMSLNVRFRLLTTPFYLALNYGIRTSVFKLLAFDFASHIQRRATLREAVNELARDAVGVNAALDQVNVK